MVVVWQSALTLFGMEFRRYLRTRRYWTLFGVICLIGLVIWLGIALLAYYAYPLYSRLMSLPYLALWIPALLNTLPVLISNRLSGRLAVDIHKGRLMTDLYLTCLHPLGVLLGRMTVVATLSALPLLALTPIAVALCALLGLPVWFWFLTVGFGVLAYFLQPAIDTYISRSIQLLPDSSAVLFPPSTTRWASFVIPSVFLFAYLLTFLIPNLSILYSMPILFSFPITVPFAISKALQNTTFSGIWLLLGLLFTLGWSGWLAMATAQWRDWWSERAYRLMRWVGTPFWLLMVGVHLMLLAQAFGGTLGEVRYFLLSTILVALIVPQISLMSGYFGLSRHRQALRLALRYPHAGFAWQSLFYWTSAVIIYIAFEVATGFKAPIVQWFFCAFYAWAAFFILPNALVSSQWLNASHFAQISQNEFYQGYWVNTREIRAYLESCARLSERGFTGLFVALGFLVAFAILVSAVRSFLPHEGLETLAGWALRAHPWYGVWALWETGKLQWYYVLYSLVLSAAWYRYARAQASRVQTSNQQMDTAS